MKIAVEGTAFVRTPKTGVDYYCYELMSAALRHDSKNQYNFVYFAPKNNSLDVNLPFDNVHQTQITKLPVKVYNALLRTPFAPAIDKLASVSSDIFFFPNFIRWPVSRSKKTVTLVYDTSYLDYPQATKTAIHRWYLSWAVPQSIRRSDAVIAISESTKQSIMRHYGTPPEKISVITPAVDHKLFKPATKQSIAAVKEKFGITGNYFLFLGTLEPRKNVLGVVTAYLQLPAEIRATHQLILAGGKGWYGNELEALIQQAAPSEIIRPGYIETAEMPALYSGATAFVFPSFFEGWGMPLVEAMACGTPVIAADNSSLPEVVADSGLLVPTGDDQALSAAMRQVASDPKLHKQLAGRSLGRAQQFSWDKGGQQLVELFQRLQP